MLVQPFLKFVADNVFDHRTNLGRNQLVFGLRRKLRIRRLNRQNAGQTLAHVFAGNGVFVFFEEVVFGNVVIDGAGQSAAETGQMRTAVFLRNVVGKAEHAFVVGIGPLQGNINLNVVLFAAESNDIFVQRRLGFVNMVNESRQTAFIMEVNLARFGTAVVNQPQINAGVQKSLFANGAFKRIEVEFGHGKGFGAGQKSYFGTVAAFGIADDFQMFNDVAVRKARQMFLALAPNAQIEPDGQSVDDRNADTVQTAGNLIGIVIELAAGVKFGHDDLGGGNALFLVHADRNAAAVVANGGRTVGIEDNLGFVAITGQSFVNGVVQHFVNHVVEAGTVIGVANIHARTFPYGVKTFQNLDRVRIVLAFFFFLFFGCHFFHSVKTL